MPRMKNRSHESVCPNMPLTGALVYEKMVGVLEGLKEVIKQFHVIRIKNRSSATSAMLSDILAAEFM